MQKSFLRVEDWAPVYNSVSNPYWLQILRIMDEFQKLVEAQKKQIVDCIKQLTYKRVQLVKQFNKYKISLKYSGEIKKQVLNIYDNDKAKYFFFGYYPQVEQIISKIGSNPRLLARMLAKDNKKFDNQDFVQSILYHLYPNHLPASIEGLQINNYLAFVEEIINQWSYDIRLGRPSSYTVIDQIINGFNKTPEIVCYVQKISISFMKLINQCKMDFFAFDQQAIKDEYQLKRSLIKTQNIQTKSKWGKFKQFFGKKTDDPMQSFHSVTSDGSDPKDLQVNVSDIMKIRQRDFLNVVKQTIKTILNQETPFLLNQMIKFFHNKIKNEIQSKNNKLNESLLSEKSVSFISNNSSQNGQFKNNLLNKFHSQCQVADEKEYFRHYCYFIITNLICQELHNKFTISHEDTGMKPADLQNIAQINKITTQIFQGHMPQGQKYKNDKLLKELDIYIQKIPTFYQQILKKGNLHSQQSQQKPKLLANTQQSNKIRQILLNLHQNTLVLSFNDIRSLICIVKTSPLFAQLNLTQKSRKMQFLSDENIKTIFQPTTKRVTFNDTKNQVQKIFFVFNSHRPSSKQVIEFYTGSDSPLKDLPLLTKSLMYESNLNVTEALQVTKCLKLMQTLSTKQIKYFLNKIALRYSSLYLKDSQILSEKFRTTIQHNLLRSINRKSILILHKDQICSRINFTEKLIQFYTEQLRSSQFYDRISQTFIHNIKIKAHMRIENDELKIYQNASQMKGVNLQTLLMTDGQTKEKNNSEQYILRTSFKSFTTIPELLNTLVRNNITRSALNSGRRVEEFNQMFMKLCFIVVSYIEQFLKKRQILQNLNKQKLAKTIVAKIQNFVYNKAKGINILQKDLTLALAKQHVNRQLFFEKDLEQLKINWQFLFQEGKKKFNLMISQKSIPQKIRHFEEMFKMVFTIISFSMTKNKISADIINPIIQYLILVSTVTKHYECLYSLQTLKWNTNPETSYNISLYESSLTYVAEMMSKDYPLEPTTK